MKYEIKKIFSSSSFFVVMVLIFILAIVSPVLTIKNYETLGKNGNLIHGTEAIKYEKQNMSRFEVLDSNLLNSALNYFKKNDNEDVYSNMEDKYPGILSLLIMAYSPPKIFDKDNLKKITNADDFYDKRVEVVEGHLNLYYSVKMFDDWEKKDILKYAKALKTPIKYGFYEGWIRLFENIRAITIVVMILAILMSSQIFSYESETGMSEVLQSFKGKVLKKVVNNKIKSVYLILFIVYTILVWGIFIAFNKYFYLDYELPIQISSAYLLSIHNYSFFESFVYQYISGLTSILSISTISMIVNRHCKKSITSLVYNLLITATQVLAPMIDKLPFFIRKFAGILPANGALFNFNLISQQVYNWFGIHILKIFSICILNVVIICTGLLILNFTKRKA